MPGRPASRQNSGEGAGVACLQRGEEAFDILGARPGGLHAMLPANLGDRSAEESALQFTGQAGGVYAPFAALGSDSVLRELLGGPVERLLRLAERCGGSGEAAGLELRVCEKEAAHFRPVEAGVAVRRVIRGLDPGLRYDVDQLGLRPAQERAEDCEPALTAHRADPAEAGNAGPALEAHQQGFGLVIGMMRGGEAGKAVPGGPGGERLVAGAPGFGLEPGGGVGHGDVEDGVRAIDSRADVLDMERLERAFQSEAVIDGGCVDSAGQGSGGEEEQGEAVRSSRDGEPERAIRLVQRLEAAAEAGDEV